MTHLEVKKLIKKDTEHNIFLDGEDSLTRKIPIQQIEATFPDSLLILADPLYIIDETGNFVINSAVVKKFCESAQEAEQFFEDLFNKTGEENYIPYHTGVTKFDKEIYLVSKDTKNSKIAGIVKKGNRFFIEQKDSLLSMSSIFAGGERCSIKDLDYEPLVGFLVTLSVPADRVREVVQTVKDEVAKIPAVDFEVNVFAKIICEVLIAVGYHPTKSFNELLGQFIQRTYTRLSKRNKIILVSRGLEDEFLIDYCDAKNYKYTLFKMGVFDAFGRDYFLKLISMILNDEVKRVIISDLAMEKMSIVEAKALGMATVKSEICLDIVGE